MFVSPKIVLRCIAVQLWYLNKFFLNWIELFCENLFSVQLFQVPPVLRKPVPCSVVSVKSVLWKPLPCSAVLSKYICFVKAWSLFSCSKISLFCKILFPDQLCWTARGTCWMEMMDWKCSHSSTPRNRKCLLQHTFFTTVIIIINCTNNV